MTLFNASFLSLIVYYYQFCFCVSIWRKVYQLSQFSFIHSLNMVINAELLLNSEAFSQDNNITKRETPGLENEYHSLLPQRKWKSVKTVCLCSRPTKKRGGPKQTNKQNMLDCLQSRSGSFSSRPTSVLVFLLSIPQVHME